MATERELVVMLLAFITAIGVVIWVSERPRLRQLRFSLRLFFIVMTFVAVVIAVLAAYSRIVLTNK